MHFVIAGSINCNQFTYAVMVAQRLKENLPHFSYMKLAKKPEDFKNWLIRLCKENNWYHVNSPIIWREIGLKSGKKEFIGDINKFLDLCYDYYGIPQDILSAEQFNKGEIDWFTKRTESEYFEQVKLDAKQRREYRSRQVCITGASSQMTEIIVTELLELKNQRRENGLEIRLFDEPMKEKRLKSATMDARCCPGPSGFGNCRVAYNLKEAFFNVDMVIVLDCFVRKPNEALIKWLKRNRNAMCALGKALNKYAPPHCRVILGGASNQPLCYNATVLASFATNLHVRNIVAVTQDLGRQTLKLLSNKTKTPIYNFYCPPVWGFVGLNKFIDLRKTLQTYIYKIPGKRMKSTLPCGREEYELRTCECLIDEEEEAHLLKAVAGRRADIFPQLGRWPYLAKATAIIDLLKVWSLKQEDGNGEILSLGVYSDGTFNIPQGIYWSQPVILKNGFWVPFAEYPIPRSPYFNHYYLFIFSVASLYRTKIKPRIYIPPKKKSSTTQKEIHKFDFDKLVEELGMPVIRTDVECAAYLKHLTKTELGIDLDIVKDYIEEEEEEKKKEPPEVIPPQEEVKRRFYCECWRQELKELQRVVFDHASNTEVEVDLSENVSGSEWSVINETSEIKKEAKSAKTDAKAAGRKVGGVYAAGSDADGNYVLEDEEKKSLENLEIASSASTVCSCGILPAGSVCKCLGTPESEKEKVSEEEKSEEEKLSTEHFYKEQNATVFEEDLKDAIYEDTFPSEKHAKFEKDSKQEDGPGSLSKFYGQKDAIKDPEGLLRRQKRIEKYERESELSNTEDEKPDTGLSCAKSDKTFAEGESEGEYMKEVEDLPPRKGSSTFLEGESALSIRTSYDSEKSEETFGESQYRTPVSFYANLPNLHGESSAPYSMRSLEDDLHEMWGESSPYDLFDKDEEDAWGKEKKRKGIPLCCLCRCLIPEGLTVCPCGESTVVEVFKKESVEVFIQNEDDIEYIVDYYDERASVNEVRDRISSDVVLPQDLEVVDAFIPTESKKKELPPESFFPFTPKPENKFQEATRPFELTKEYAESFDKSEVEIPPKCAELINAAEMELRETTMVGEDGELFEFREKEVEGESMPSPICEEVDQIKTDFSDLKMFVPCGLEDWRVTVQRKYREWFFQGPKIKDETYYDVAIEEISEDEFELDKDLEKFFEC